MLVILTWLAGACIVVLVLATALPLRLEIVLNKSDTWRFKARVRPFGRFGPSIPLSSRARSKKKSATRKPKKRRASRFKGRSPQNIAGGLVGLVADLVGCLRIESATVQARFGFEDPSVTGHVYGMLTPLIYGIGAHARTHWRIEPVFDQTLLTGELKTVVSVVPARVMLSFLKFGWRVWGARL